MKIARFVLKVVALSLTVAAGVCCVIAFWDKIAEFFHSAKTRLVDKAPCICRSEFDDYADWDE